MNVKTLFLAISLITGLVSMQAVQAATPAQKQNSSLSVTLDIQNMTCAMCPITVRKALQSVEGVQRARWILAAKQQALLLTHKKPIRKP